VDAQLGGHLKRKKKQPGLGDIKMSERRVRVGKNLGAARLVTNQVASNPVSNGTGCSVCGNKRRQ